jgi:hypothetical protein
VSRTERREVGWITRLDGVMCGIDWPARLFTGAGRDETWAGVKVAGPCTEKNKQRRGWADSRVSWVSAHSE